MGKHSKSRRDMKQTKKSIEVNKKNAAKLIQKKSVGQQIEDQVFNFSNLIIYWKHRLITLLEQMSERKAYFTEKNDEIGIKKCEAIINDLHAMQNLVPEYIDTNKEMILKLAETKEKINHAEKGMAMLELLEIYHNTYRKYEGVTKNMDVIVQNMHIVMQDELPKDQIPKFTASSDGGDTPQVELISHDTHFEDVRNFGKPIPNTTPENSEPVTENTTEPLTITSAPDPGKSDIEVAKAVLNS